MSYIGSTVKLYYRVDGGSWTEIFTDDSASGITIKEKARDANQSNFTSGYEYEFKIESTGGGEVIELTYNYDVIETQI